MARKSAKVQPVSPTTTVTPQVMIDTHSKTLRELKSARQRKQAASTPVSMDAKIAELTATPAVLKKQAAKRLAKQMKDGGTFDAKGATPEASAEVQRRAKAKIAADPSVNRLDAVSEAFDEVHAVDIDRRQRKHKIGKYAEGAAAVAPMQPTTVAASDVALVDMGGKQTWVCPSCGHRQHPANAWRVNNHLTKPGHLDGVKRSGITVTPMAAGRGATGTTRVASSNGASPYKRSASVLPMTPLEAAQTHLAKLEARRVEFFAYAPQSWQAQCDFAIATAKETVAKLVAGA
jgi:hypothetical protein